MKLDKILNEATEIVEELSSKRRGIFSKILTEKTETDERIMDSL